MKKKIQKEQESGRSMRWYKNKSPKERSTRIIIKFCWLPTKVDEPENCVVWLEKIFIHQKFIIFQSWEGTKSYWSTEQKSAFKKELPK